MNANECGDPELDDEQDVQQLSAPQLHPLFDTMFRDLGLTA